MYTQSTSTRLAAVILIGLLCTALSAPSVRADDILNSSFEVDPPGTEKDDITDWDFEMVSELGTAPEINEAVIVDDYYFTGDQSVYLHLQTDSVYPDHSNCRAAQYLSTSEPLDTDADYVTIWVGGAGYTTSSRYYWRIILQMTDGVNDFSDVLRCDCWGLNEGCNPNHYDYYDATATGADGQTWKRYTRAIPPEMDKSNLTVTIKHHRNSWDYTEAASWFRLDDVYFSDADGEPCEDGDIALVSVIPDATTVEQGDSLSVDVTVENLANCPATFDVTALYGSGTIPNSGFEADPPGTEKDDITDWDFEMVSELGTTPEINELLIVDDYYFTGDQSVYFHMQTDSAPPDHSNCRAAQYLSTSEPAVTTADYITLWVGGAGYTTSSRYYWNIQLQLTDGANNYSEKLRCDCWGLNEGCTPNHYDYYDATATGADGQTWKRYTRAIPPEMDRSNLTVTIKHHRNSWDYTQSASWYRLDGIYFSDADGNAAPGGVIGMQTVTELDGGAQTGLAFLWDTTGVPPGDYPVFAVAHPLEDEANLADNVLVGDTVTVELHYALTISTTVGGTTDPVPGEYEHLVDSMVAVTAIPDEHYVFDHWELDSVDVGSDNPYTVLIDDDHALTAFFGKHDVAVPDVAPADTVVSQGDTASIDITVENVGDYTETFDVTAFYGAGTIPNSGFEADPPGTEKDDITDWDFEMVSELGTTPEINELSIVDDYYFAGDQSVYFHMQTHSVYPDHSNCLASQYLSTSEPVATTADYVTLWVGGAGYTTSSRYYWTIRLELTDGVNNYSEKLRCDCWGLNEGCTPNHFDYADATVTGADGNTWSRYTRAIPPGMNKSNLTVTIRHRRNSWDYSESASWYRLDGIYFSDADGNALPGGTIDVQTVTDLPLGAQDELTFLWDTSAVPPGEYLVGAYADPVEDETDTANNGAVADDEITILPPAPLPEPVPVPKNRYISFQPNNGTNTIAYQVEMVAGPGGPIVAWVGEPGGDNTAYVMDEPYFSSSWPTVVDVGDCEIVPVADYEIRATTDQVYFSDPLAVSTIPQPGMKFWADCVGPFAGTWTPPNGNTSMDDIMAVLQGFMHAPTAPPTTWVDLHEEVPNRIVSMSDVMLAVNGFKGDSYPYSNPDSCSGGGFVLASSDGGEADAAELPFPEQLIRDAGGILIANSAKAAEATITLIPRKTTVPAGGAVAIDVFTTGAHGVSAYEVALDVSSGDSGSLDVDSLFIDVEHEDYAFALVDALPAVDEIGRRLGAVSLTDSVDAIGDLYLGTFVLQASPDAAGTFIVNLQGGESTSLIDQFARPMAFEASPGAEVAVGITLQPASLADDSKLNRQCRE